MVAPLTIPTRSSKGDVSSHLSMLTPTQAPRTVKTANSVTWAAAEAASRKTFGSSNPNPM
jgi:hypothetical protein